MAGRPKKIIDTTVTEKPKKTGVPKIQKPPSPQSRKVVAEKLTNNIVEELAIRINTIIETTASEIKEDGSVDVNIAIERDLKPLEELSNESDITTQYGIIMTPAIEYREGILSYPTEDESLDALQEKPKELNKPKEPNMEAIIKKYDQLCETASDINQLLPYLRAIAEQCDTIVEFGVRQPTSTYALLAGNPKSLTSYDIYRDPLVDEVEAMAPNFKFVLGSSLEVEIEECDFIFLDTVHTYTQMERELAKHGNKARRFWAFHDTESYRLSGEPFYPGPPSDVWCGRGIWPAIENFLRFNPHWKIDFHATNNNGLTILRRTN